MDTEYNFKTTEMRTKILDHNNDNLPIVEYDETICLTDGDYLEYKGEQWNVTSCILNIDKGWIEIMVYNSEE